MMMMMMTRWDDAGVSIAEVVVVVTRFTRKSKDHDNEISTVATVVTSCRCF
jgi:hypothetical protein